MRLISRFDARALSLAELYSLRKAMFVAMRASPRGSTWSAFSARLNAQYRGRARSTHASSLVGFACTPE